MKSSCLLPLLLYIPSLQAASTFTTSTTHDNNETKCYFDPFYHLRPSPLPTCSLSSSPASETHPEILSFEEWKKAREIAAEHSRDLDNASHHARPAGDAAEDMDSARASGSPDGTLAAGGEDGSVQEASNVPVRVPLKDRFNFASQDCTARIFASQKGSKSPSAILSSKKDRYMLSPCATKNKFVVVELCDDVRIDTVQLANLEFFSGVFKDVRFSFAETANADWVDAGVYRAKNMRGVQSFHPPAGRQKFYRYIRVDFLSHYGSEYYCPVTLLRVYGLTHMDDYKWAGWQSDHVRPLDIPAPSRAPSEAEPTVAASTTSSPASQTGPDISTHSSSTEPSTTESHTSPTVDASPEASNSEGLASTTPLATPEPSVNHAPPKLSDTDVLATRESAPDGVAHDGSTVSAEVPKLSASPSSPAQASVTNPPTGSGSGSTVIIVSSSGTIAEISTAILVDATTKKTVSASSPTATHSSTALIATGGESIYRTIMKRLQMLEGNITLGVSYMEEQMRSVRDVVRRLEEDVGRLDALGQRQQRIVDRILQQMDQERMESARNIRSIMVEVQTLSREVALEKRLGFIQLCLLICAFIFMGYTRGTREQTIIQQASAGGMRTLESWRSGDWTRWRTRRASGDLARPAAPAKAVARKNSAAQPARKLSIADPFEFPSSASQADAGPSTAAPTHAVHLSRSRQRVISSPSVPMSLMRKSSPRRLAPHLHEVKAAPEPSKRRHQIDLTESDGEPDDAQDDAGTPRARRTIPHHHYHGATFRQQHRRQGSSQSHLSPTLKAFPAFPHKGKEREREPTPNDDREVSPASTAAAPPEDSSEDSSMWEDTSADEDELASVSSPPPIPHRPLPVPCDAPNPSQETIRVA